MQAGSSGTVVLVHGGFVDGSGWQGVYDHLKKDGYNVAVVQNPTLSLKGDVAATNMIIDAQSEPVILVGHSYGGAVITEAGTNPNVAALVYIAAFAPDKGESVGSLIKDPPPGAPVRARGMVSLEKGTSHFVAVDRWGNVASETSTIESGFGSGLMVNGYYLNNELTDFSFVPTMDGLPVANRIEGGKRPRSSMSPTIVYGPDGRIRLAIGAAGGATIIVQVAKAIMGVVDWKLSAQEALGLEHVRRERV